MIRNKMNGSGAFLWFVVTICAIVMGWTMVLFLRAHQRLDRLLLGLIALVAFHHGVRTYAGNQGDWHAPRIVDEFVSFAVATMYLGTVLIFRVTDRRHRVSEKRIRLAEAGTGLEVGRPRHGWTPGVDLPPATLALLESSHLPVFVTRENGEPLYCNPAARKLGTGMRWPAAEAPAAETAGDADQAA